MPASPVTHLFVDIGGVLLTNGWDRHVRRRVADRFELDWEEMEERHHLTYDTYELGKSTLDRYLEQVVFYRPRPYSAAEVTAFIFAQAEPLPEMIELVRELKRGCALTVAAVSNEGRELAEDRIRRFRLGEVVDFFVVSSFVHFRKPDEDIYRIALDVAQAAPGQVAYVEDRRLLVEVGGRLGLRTVWHRDVATTREALERLGLPAPA